MSFTETLSGTTSSTPIVLLTPSKRRRITTPERQSQPSKQDILKWTFTNGAIAPCFLRDVVSMTEDKGHDFFWLGRVPCRIVKIVGIVVGVQIWEKRIVYSVDDGTFVVDCFHRHTPPPQQHASPNKNKGKDSLVISQDPPQAPVPVADVGCFVKVIGKVTKWHEGRQINVTRIEPCHTSNDEPHHWLTVLRLHRTSYDLPDPFIIPAQTLPPLTPTPNRPSLRPPTPSNTFPTPLISPTKSLAQSPTKSITDAQSPPKLRHPSGLRTRDLTANTFRIYLKHYMDNAPLHTGTYYSDARIGDNIAQCPVTPTKSRPRYTPYPSVSSMTPRPKSVEQTPRLHPTVEEIGEDQLRGFTFSYLRRVPELYILARKVVGAEAKRRAIDERKKIKDNSVSKGTPLLEKDKTSSRMKRLLRWAIVKLYEEGSIILWDGPVRSPTTQIEGSGLWKVNSSTNSSISRDGTSISSIGEDEHGELGEMSDPEAEEEAYIPLTPAYLAGYVENSIKALLNRSSNQGKVQSSVHQTTALGPGPTKEDITAYLRKRDSRWAKVGEWAVGDALEFLRTEGRVWDVGKGRWEVCL